MLSFAPLAQDSYDPNRAAEWWNVSNDTPVESDSRKRFPATENQQ
ncbi:MAG: hypothetical protein R3C99_27330 [Pirellulaceae bacterium]